MAFYVNTTYIIMHYALRLGKTKGGISILSCYVSKETENVMKRKKNVVLTVCQNFPRCGTLSLKFF